AEDEKDLHAKLDEALEQREVGDLLIGHQQHRPIDEFQRGLRLRIVERIRGEAVQHARRVAEERFGVDELDERFADDGLLIGKPPVANDAVDRPIELGRDVGADFRHFTVLNTLNFMSSWNVMVETRSSRDSRSAWWMPSSTISIQNPSSYSLRGWRYFFTVSPSFGTRLSSRM